MAHTQQQRVWALGSTALVSLAVASLCSAQSLSEAPPSEALSNECGSEAAEPPELAPEGGRTEASGTRGGSDDAAPESRGALGWFLDHTTALPILLYAPETSVMGGVGGITSFDLTGQPDGRPSNISLLGIYTARKQTILLLESELRGPDDRHILWQYLRYIDWPDRFFGVGNALEKGVEVSDGDDQTRDYEKYTDRYVQLESEYLHRLWRRLYLGLRHQLRLSWTPDIEMDARRLRSGEVFGVGDLFWHGLGPSVVWDDREGLIWPTAGNMLRADVTFYEELLGSDFSAQFYRLDLRHYRTLWLDHVLGLHLALFGATGEPPFQLLPALGGPDRFRGWYLGKLRDRVLAMAEAEYRVPVYWRFALVGFGAVGRVAGRVDQLDPADLRGAGGLGLRFAVNPEQKANIRLDVAYGQELEIYFQFKEAF